MISSVKAQDNASLVLNGDAYVSSDLIDIDNVNFTVELWAFKNDWSFNEKQSLISYGKESSVWRLFGTENSLDLQLNTSTGVVNLSHPLLEMPSGWHHIAFSCDGRYIRLYIDGSQRDYLYFAGGIEVSSPQSPYLICGAQLDASMEVENTFIGLLDEVRVWEVNRSSQQIASAMHLDLMHTESESRNGLLVCYPFNANSFFASYNSIKSDSYALLNYENVSISHNIAPVSSLKDDYRYDAQGYWALYAPQIYSEPSGGMHLSIISQNQLELDEFDVFGHNGNMGITDDVGISDLDLQSRRVWYYDAHHDFETMAFRFDLSDAEAIGLLNACLKYENYKLLYKASAADSFKIIASAYMLDGDNLYFYDIEGKDGFYALGRDNSVPTVVTNTVENIGNDLAFGGGIITCDGGAMVTQRGLCWSLQPHADLNDSISIDGVGSGSFDSKLTHLIPGYTYYVRAYAINTEGIAYGDEIIIRTIKLNQSLVFPPIDPQVFGVAPFNAGAYTSSGLAITYRSSDTTVVRVRNGFIHVVGVGSTNIWAVQEGNQSYNATSYRKIVLSVSKAEQHILGMEDVSIVYGDSLALASIVASSGLLPRLALSDSSLFAFTDTGVFAKKIGVATLFAVQEGDSRYLASQEQSCKISINKKDLELSFSYDTISYTGVARELLEPCVADSLSMLVTYNQDSSLPVSAGRYKVLVMVDDEFYEGSDSGVVTILKATPIIVEWPELSDVFAGESLAMSFLLGGDADIDGSFNIVDQAFVPSYSGEKVAVMFVPDDTVNYKIMQGSSQVYFNILTSTDELKNKAFEVWPTVSRGELSIKTERRMVLGIFDLSGREVKSMNVETGLSEISLEDLKRGRYFLRDMTKRRGNEVKSIIII